MYNLLNEYNKDLIINNLISDLDNKNRETRRIAIKVLSELRNKGVYDSFLKMINDEDWIIRYDIIKALSKKH